MRRARASSQRKYLRRRRPQSLAKKAYALAKKAYRMPELKYVTGDTVGTNVNFNGFSFQSCIPAQGTSDTTRLGDKVICKRFTMNGCFLTNGAGLPAICRIIGIINKEQAIPTITNILQNTASERAVFSPYIWDTNMIYKKIYDRTFNLSSQEYASEGKKEFHININLRNLRASFMAASTTTVSNAVQWFFLSDRNVNTPTVSYVWRTTFVDA